MKNLGYDKENHEQLVALQHQLTCDVQALKEKLNTLEAKYVLPL